MPKHLAAFYQSNGGDTSGSSIKIHQTVELLKFAIVDFVITDGKDNDGNYWENKNLMAIRYLAKGNYEPVCIATIIVPCVARLYCRIQCGNVQQLYK